MSITTILMVVFFITTMYLFYYYLRKKSDKKQRYIFGDYPVKKIELSQVDGVFKTSELGPSHETEIKFIANYNVKGGTTDFEAWILSVLAKRAKRMFEFGTCTGKTTYLLAANSAEDALITTLTLAPDQIKDYNSEKQDYSSDIRNALQESIFSSFYYSGQLEEKKITQLFIDSKLFDEEDYEKSFDFIFIDGSHAYSYVKSDSQKALKMIKPGGIIAWHDYHGPRRARGVFKALNELNHEIELRHIPNTCIVIHKAEN